MCRHEERASLALGAVATAQDSIARARRFLKRDDPDSADQVLRGLNESLQSAVREASAAQGECDVEEESPIDSEIDVAMIVEVLEESGEASLQRLADTIREREAVDSVPRPRVEVLAGYLERNAAEITPTQVRKVARELLTGPDDGRRCPKCRSPHVRSSDVEVVECLRCGYEPHAPAEGDTVSRETSDGGGDDLPEGVVRGSVV